MNSRFVYSIVKIRGPLPHVANVCRLLRRAHEQLKAVVLFISVHKHLFLSLKRVYKFDHDSRTSRNISRNVDEGIGALDRLRTTRCRTDDTMVHVLLVRTYVLCLFVILSRSMR